MRSYSFDHWVDVFLRADHVEFSLSYDYRSSRWLAVSLTKVESALNVSGESFNGIIVIKADPQQKYKVSHCGGGRGGLGGGLVWYIQLYMFSFHTRRKSRKF